MLRTVLVFAAIAAAFSSTARAGEIVIPIRAQQTAVTWTLGAPLHAVHGQFRVADGSLRFEPESNATSGTITIDLASGESGNAKRDANMRSEVLETSKYPVAIFTARSIAGRLDPSGSSHVMLAGSLFIHGAKHDLVLPLDIVTRDGAVESGETRFTVPYVAWGMHDPSVFLLRVSDHVDVDVRLSGIGHVPTR